MSSIGSTPGRGRRIAIIGAGPGGMCMGIRLAQAGFENFAIFEKGSGVGGTWYHNRYPGAACDVQSHLYSFSFEPKLDWTRPYATQPEIRAYFEHCAAKYGLTPHVRFDTPVRSAHWDDECLVWRLVTAQGEEFVADVVVSGMGMFNELHVPEIPGLESFAGTRFHSARWNHAHDLSGERVGVIGSAASAVQFIPEITTQAAQVYLYQRTANWVLPKEDDPYTPEQLEAFRRDPMSVRRHRLQIFRDLDEIQTFSAPHKLRKAEELGLRAE
jgi:cation diffusion facilitator CzcD-associated flavoprotein CzcO